MPKAYLGKTDGTPWMHRMLVVMFRHVDDRVIYPIVAVVVFFYMIFRPDTAKVQYDFFRHHLHVSRWRAMWNVYRNFFLFGQVIMDRFAAYAGQNFRCTLTNSELFYDYVKSPQGFIVLGAHFGNFEMAGYQLAAPDKTMNVLVYANETESVMQRRQQILAPHNIFLIPMKEDMSHVYCLNQAMENGQIVVMAADRVSTPSRALKVKILDETAYLPKGPFALAVMQQCPVLLFFVVKIKGKEYRMFVSELQMDKDLSRPQQIQHLAEQYADALSQKMREYPLQWFTYYDIWKEKTWL